MYFELIISLILIFGFWFYATHQKENDTKSIIINILQLVGGSIIVLLVYFLILRYFF